MIPTQYVGFSERPKFMGATWGQFSYHKHLGSTGRDDPSITKAPLLDLNTQPHMHNCQTLGSSKGLSVIMIDPPPCLPRRMNMRWSIVVFSISAHQDFRVICRYQVTGMLI